MKKTGKLFIALSLAVIYFWAVPWIYRIVTLKSYTVPFTLYSCILHDFTWLDRGEGKSFTLIDRQGRKYGEEVQPMFYSKVVFSKGAMPDTIEGRPVTMEEIERNALILTIDPEDENKRLAPVYPLMESVPLRLELQEPEEAFVCRKDGLYLYDMDSGDLLTDKSKAFTEALRAEGFSFPAKLVHGNPSDHKDHDEGYLLTDARGHLYHLKQVDGAPEAEHIGAADGLALKGLHITEFANHRTLGLLVDEANVLYWLQEDRSIVPTEVRYDPSREDFMLVGDMFYYTIKVSDQTGDRLYALRESDFSLVDTMSRTYPVDEEDLSEWLFPFRLTFTSGTDPNIHLRVRDFSWKALLLYVVLGCGICVALRGRKHPHK